MKCESVQTLLPRYLTKELPARDLAQVADHLSDCAECREALAFHRTLETQLDAVVRPPDSLRSRVTDRIESQPGRPALLARVFGESTMRKILISSTLATALAVGAIFLAPRSAVASTPEETLKSMRAALAKAVKTGELSLDLKANQDGTVTVTGTLDGQPLPPDFPFLVEVSRDGDIFDVTVTVDFSTESYKHILFGKSGALVLYPKAKPEVRYEIVLDGKTKKPTTWTTLSSNGKAWTVESRSDFKPKPSAPPTKDDDTVIKARVKIMLGQTASITTKPG